MSRAGQPLALTLGDPAGIGPDIGLLAWKARRHETLPSFVLIGDEAVLANRAQALGLSVPIVTVDEVAQATELFTHALPVLPVPAGVNVAAGRPDKAAMAAVIRSIELGVSLVQQDAARAIVTNPVSKATLYDAGFAFPGHTEYLAALAGGGSRAPHPVMMLASGTFRVVPITIHIPLKEVAQVLTKDLILTTIEITAKDLGRLFGIEQPRLAVSGLNPHAGEEGNLGLEEVDTIAPAIATARARGIDVSGPYPADTLFHAAARQTYDAAICMYHDQALVPFKTLAFEEGVNVTLGLPFVRTSPDHGTAFAIAGSGKANPRSLIEALRLADTMSRTAEAKT